jgi:hypothetical protein
MPVNPQYNPWQNMRLWTDPLPPTNPWPDWIDPRPVCASTDTHVNFVTQPVVLVEFDITNISGAAGTLNILRWFSRAAHGNAAMTSPNSAGSFINTWTAGVVLVDEHFAIGETKHFELEEYGAISNPDVSLAITPDWRTVDPVTGLHLFHVAAELQKPGIVPSPITNGLMWNSVNYPDYDLQSKVVIALTSRPKIAFNPGIYYS